ncbi:hypothetical protein HI914_07096 [Erysiphe necator]|nr:hypothetical protein HI914_07096 [Erysiphe necator]
MHLYLFPISTRRTLIFCQKSSVIADKKKIHNLWLDYGITRATKLWSGWEQKEAGWQKSVVLFGNMLLEKIPFEEWALKSIPPLPSTSRHKAKVANMKKIEVTFPQSLILESKVLEITRKLGTQRQKWHRSRMIISLIGMPLCIPLTIIPVIPNLPFFYLVFRAWSHWKALSGSKHIQFLLDNNLITTKPLPILDELYVSAGKLLHSKKQSSLTSEREISISSDPGNLIKEGPKEVREDEERILLSESSSKKIADALSMPELEIELSRAIRQVESAGRTLDH